MVFDHRGGEAGVQIVEFQLRTVLRCLNKVCEILGADMVWKQCLFGF